MDTLPEPAPRLLAEARRVTASRAEHDRLAASLPCLHAVELVAPPQPRQLGSRIRIASWNAERCKYASESASLLAGIGADIVLLTEMDVGMARSGNRHTPRELARSLASGYAFGVEYVELGLGDDREKAWHADRENAVGLHGNALFSKANLNQPVVIRLDEGARWFAGEQSTAERRIGARMAIAATIDVGRAPLVVASVHLESSTDARDRASQVAVLLRAIDERAAGIPVVIGGDFNTSALDLPALPRAGWRGDRVRQAPRADLRGGVRPVRADAGRAIMVGDNLATDIIGAGRAGLASLLVLNGGVHGGLQVAEFAVAARRHGAWPTYIAPAFAW